MQKIPFEKYKIDFLGETIEARVPFSVHSALLAEGLTVPKSAAEERKSLGELKISAQLFADGAFLSSEYLYLRVSGLTLGCRLFLNGQALGYADSRSSLSSFSVKEKATLGENNLELVFTGTESELLYAGLVGKIELVRFNSAIIDDVSVTERLDGSSVTLEIKTDFIGSLDGVRAVATLVSGSGQIYYGGLTKGRGKITVPDPLLWWPRGLGIQNLYKLTVNLYGDMEIEDTVEMRIGLCSYATAVDQRSATVEINGVPMLPMGAVYREIPEPCPAVRRQRTEAVVASAAIAGFNTLVIPAGAPLPAEDFYSLCDLYGIAVIHEIKTLTPEICDLLLRRSHHPSVRLFDLYTYGESVDEVCEKIRALYGDAELSFFEKLPEYPAFSSLVTESTLEEQLTHPLPNPYSRAAEALIPNIGGAVSALSGEYPYPSCLSDVSYLSQLRAASGLEGEMLTRRLRAGAGGRAVFDGIAPIAETSSPAVLDGSLRYKAQLYRAKSFFSPVVLTASREGASVAFSVVNSRRSGLSGEIEFSVIDNSNNKVYSGRENCTVGEGEARRLFVADLSEFVSGYESERYLEYILREGSTVLSRGVLLFVPAKHFDFKNPAIRHEISGSQRRYSITLSAESFAYMTEVSFGSLPVRLSDNYVALTSRSPLKLSFETPGKDLSLSELEAALKIRCIYDVINP